MLSRQVSLKKARTVLSSSDNYANELDVITRLAYAAGAIMRTYWDTNKELTYKTDSTPLTKADLEINHMVITELAKAFPDDVVIGEEESTGDIGAGRRWFCDPIDGTKAFTWGVPTAMFSLALVVDGRPVVGVCYEPITDRLYSAVSGGGAFCNGNKLQVNTQVLSAGIVGTISSADRIRRGAPYLDALLDSGTHAAVFSGAVAKSVRVAEGRFVGYIEELANAHDIAAVDVIVGEAGGATTKLDGSVIDYSQPFRGAVVSNNVVHDELVGFVRDSGLV